MKKSNITTYGSTRRLSHDDLLTAAVAILAVRYCESSDSRVYSDGMTIDTATPLIACCPANGVVALSLGRWRYKVCGEVILNEFQNLVIFTSFTAYEAWYRQEFLSGAVGGTPEHAAVVAAGQGAVRRVCTEMFLQIAA